MTWTARDKKKIIYGKVMSRGPHKAFFLSSPPMSLHIFSQYYSSAIIIKLFWQLLLGLFDRFFPAALARLIRTYVRQALFCSVYPV